MGAGTILIFIPFIAAVAACIAETRKKDQTFPRNLTIVGWFLIVLAGASAYLNYTVNREKTFGNAIRESLGLRQIETAIYMLMSPPVALSDPPELKERFHVAETYGKAGAVSGLCEVELSAEVKSNFADPQYQKATWAVYITERTREGLTRLSNAQASYGSFFDDETNRLLGQIISHPWNEFLVESRRRAETGQKKSDAEPKKPLCLEKADIRKRYEALADSYWPIVRDLESRIGRRNCKLRSQIGLNDIPPLFLRSLSGYFFVPDPKEMADAMDQVCKDFSK